MLPGEGAIVSFIAHQPFLVPVLGKLSSPMLVIVLRMLLVVQGVATLVRLAAVPLAVFVDNGALK